MPKNNQNGTPDQLSNNEQQNNFAERITELEKRLNQTITEWEEAKEMARVQKKYQRFFPHIQARAEEWAQLREQKTTYDEQGKKWWFKPNEKEKTQLAEAGEVKELEKLWQEIKDRRNFWTSGFCLALCFLIFFGWDKFYAWYEKPLTEEWGWPDDDEEEEDETTEKKVKIAEEPKPQPKNWWEWIMNNKMRTISLVLIILGSLWLMYKIARLLMKA